MLGKRRDSVGPYAGAFTPALVLSALVAALSITVDAAVPAVPSGLAARVTGTTVNLLWTGGAGATSYIVEAGSASGLNNLANIVTGTSAPAFTAVGVPAGTYYVRVRGMNLEGMSAPSNEVVVVVAGCAVPLPPAGLAFTVDRTLVRLGWTAGTDAESFIVEAGSAPGLANLFNANIGRPASNEFFASAPPGVYYVRVRAASACGVSLPSNEVMVVVGGAATTVISFAGLPAGPFTSTTTSGYSVLASAASWNVVTTFGNPAPFIQFTNPAGQPPQIGDITISSSTPFRFGSVDVYASITPIPYTFVGVLNSVPVFTVTGTVPNTFGQFATVMNPNSGALIDTLLIRLTNPQTACCTNPMGLDNIVLVR
jgi:hypothetical protein